MIFIFFIQFYFLFFCLSTPAPIRLVRFVMRAAEHAKNNNETKQCSNKLIQVNDPFIEDVDFDVGDECVRVGHC